MTERLAFLETIAKFSFHRQRALQIFEGLLVFAKLLVAIADQANRDCLALSIAITAKERQGFLKLGQRNARTFLGIELSRVSQDVDRLSASGAVGTDEVWADANP